MAGWDQGTDRPRVTGGWRWARLQLVDVERRDEELLVDVLQQGGDAVDTGDVPRGYPATLTFGPAAAEGACTAVEQRLRGWLGDEDPVVDCFAALLPPGPTVVIVHDEDYLVIDGATGHA